MNEKNIIRVLFDDSIKIGSGSPNLFCRQACREDTLAAKPVFMRLLSHHSY
jgi:hypothetical protein